jgi:putative ABC transport system permease protein
MVVVPLREQVTRGVRAAALVFLAGISIVLLVACANVAGLLLARGATRQRELTIRSALGASRWRLVRQQFAESLVLGSAGGAAGLLLAGWIVHFLTRLPFRSDSVFVPYSVPREAIGLDAVALAFTAVVSFVSMLLFGLLPALTGSRTADADALRGTGRSTAGRRQQRVRAALVTGEVALALVLLVTAALTIRSFAHLQRIDPGFSPAGVLTVKVTLSPGTYREPPAIERYYRDALDRIRGVAGVVAAGVVDYLPLTGMDSSTGFFIEGRPAPARADEQQVHQRSVSAGYFQTLGATILRGRDFTARDGSDAPKVAIINEAMARRYWPGEDPVGRRIALDLETMRYFPDRPPERNIPAAMREIVGIVRDIRHASLQAQPQPEMYTPSTQRPVLDMTFVVRSAGDPLTLAAAVRDAVREADPSQPVGRIEVLSAIVSSSIAQPRANFVLLAAFAGVALMLAMVGVFGLLSYSVAQRTPELGIRLALGGSPRHLQGLILGEAVRLVALGTVFGLAGAVLVARAMRTLLVGVAATDAVSLAGSVLLLVLVAAVASWLPARRAMAVDPVAALRPE